MVKATSPPTLYQQDLVAWCDDTVAKLKAGDFAALDINAPPSLRQHWPNTFPELWENALSDAREDHPQTVFPDRWPGSTDLDALLSEKVW
ncbi:DUF29 family protein [Nodosilinea sp. LEGE 06152]|uniref:DUF29 family protein n=1 Tax=Nodosilinea sp. LEGE 06152 TaxID=2777966 RepID=UPI001882207D|nr:DUF29 family protein [Nodosilinea sp. LEGE 06152]MBE9159947.1 DUF29 family protein [Nodosilinea sp. LEGE 06152]